MKTTEVRVTLYKCLRCGHLTRTRDGGAPERCGGCKSPYWKTPRNKK